MKHLLKLMTFAAMAALLTLSCGKKDDPQVTPEKPVVTTDMFSVTANAESGEVTFKFTGNGLSPFWTVTEPGGNKSTFTDREVTKTYTIKGVYNGTIIAYGDGGQSDPVSFSFTIGSADPTLSATENILVSTTWKIRKYGWYGGEGEEYWDYFEKAPTQAADIRMTFNKGGAFTLNLGGATVVYNDAVTGGWQDAPTVTGSEKWAYVKEGDKEYIQFSNGGYPGMLGGDAAVNGKYLISDLEADTFMLSWQQTEEQWFAVILVPEYFEEPVITVSEDAVKAALTGKTFQISDYGWWGEGWQWFSVADGEEEIPANMANDFITFNADGTLTIELGLDDPLEEGGEAAARIYNDGVTNGEVYTVTGTPKWAVVTDGGAVKVAFSDGGFPLVIAGKNDDPSDPDHHLGLDAKWNVRSIDEDGIVGLEIFQPWTGEQWLAVFLAPVAE